MIDETMAAARIFRAKPNNLHPRITPGHSGERQWWEVGGDRVELDPVASWWTVRVRRDGWGDVPLVVDGRFSDKAEAIAWCERMADVLLRDLDDEEA